MWETSYQILRSTVLWYSWNPLSWARTSFSTANKSSVPSLEIAFSILTEENYIWTGSSDVTTALFRTWHSQHPLLRPRPQTEGAPFPLTSRGEESLSETFNPNDTALCLLSFPFRERGGKKERKFKVLTCYYFLKSFPSSWSHFLLNMPVVVFLKLFCQHFCYIWICLVFNNCVGENCWIM